jgi:hypothetical protein
MRVGISYKACTGSRAWPDVARREGSVAGGAFNDGVDGLPAVAVLSERAVAGSGCVLAGRRRIAARRDRVQPREAQMTNSLVATEGLFTDLPMCG